MTAFEGPRPSTTATRRLLIYCSKATQLSKSYTADAFLCNEYGHIINTLCLISFTHVRACIRVGGGVTTWRAAWTAGRAPRGSPHHRPGVLYPHAVRSLLHDFWPRLHSIRAHGTRCVLSKKKSRGICLCSCCTAVTPGHRACPSLSLEYCLSSNSFAPSFMLHMHRYTQSRENPVQLGCHPCQMQAVFPPCRLDQLTIGRPCSPELLASRRFTNGGSQIDQWTKAAMCFVSKSGDRSGEAAASLARQNLYPGFAWQPDNDSDVLRFPRLPGGGAVRIWYRSAWAFRPTPSLP